MSKQSRSRSNGQLEVQTCVVGRTLVVTDTKGRLLGKVAIDSHGNEFIKPMIHGMRELSATDTSRRNLKGT